VATQGSDVMVAISPKANSRRSLWNIAQQLADFRKRQYEAVDVRAQNQQISSGCLAHPSPNGLGDACATYN